MSIEMDEEIKRWTARRKSVQPALIGPVLKLV